MNYIETVKKMLNKSAENECEEMRDLKPCPFCGGNPKLISNEIVAYVRCENCNSKTETISADARFNATDKVIAIWNQRT